VRHALKDLSFNVRKGEVVAVIGRNGSGKSTILMLLSRVYLPTSGELRVRGKTLSLLELGAGFNTELSGRDNVYFNASVYGTPDHVVDALYDPIVEFSGLDKQAMDLPTRSYSSGMQLRLAFALTVHLDGDVLLLDEGLAVGDESFRAKCYNRIMEHKAAGKTILIVSHDLKAVEMLADRVIWLDRGRIKVEGETAEILAAYRAEMNAHVSDAPI
jgi:ABC-type polysaccharide/polyol phosphate transport system ATPase subunit